MPDGRQSIDRIGRACLFCQTGAQDDLPSKWNQENHFDMDRVDPENQ